MAALAAAGLLSLVPAVQAEDPAPTPPPAARGAARMTPEAQLKNLTEKLALTAEQQPKVKALLEEGAKARQTARDLSPEERRTKVAALREETTKKMKAILTGDQFKKYEEILKTQQGPRGARNADGQAPAEGGAKKKKAE